MFSPQFLGAFPYALSPFGALAYLGVSTMFVEDSSTKTSRLGSTPLRRSLKALRAPSSRSVAPSVFFRKSIRVSLAWPGSSWRWTRGGARALLPKFAVALKGRLVVLLELAPQKPLLLEG